MRVKITGYNPLRDIACCRPGLAIDLAEALKNNAVAPTSIQESYNGIDDPDKIAGVVTDLIEAQEATDVYAAAAAVAATDGNQPSGEKET